MLEHFDWARVVGTGDYVFEGRRYPWVLLTQFGPELPEHLRQYASGQPVRYTVRLPEGVALPQLAFGDVLAGWTLTEPETKIVKGTDRSVDRQVGRVVAIESVNGVVIDGQPAADLTEVA